MDVFNGFSLMQLKKQTGYEKKEISYSQVSNRRGVLEK